MYRLSANDQLEKDSRKLLQSINQHLLLPVNRLAKRPLSVGAAVGEAVGEADVHHLLQVALMDQPLNSLECSLVECQL